ncbi:chemotaxis protein CheW [Pseudomonas sp. 21LCFQ02]|uniref:chemotaxis protein CheW n=1 Tax=unclassified Pseudomonas TaxID=196821 RepID=UPI0004F87EB2|nr:MULTISPECIES: chemotaxis protein CheW [unclassified Pseudomonas]MCO8161581.1 chemotaxis protein CheW [Pseudomonas sp. 21LCFQ010]MCO8168546.1 chemotaxis protein CheW [Pseudomonas sp. 21LCFQ02]MCO8169651.1 chemotaxis protein CheW [Pseudomonas sp. 21LCFQ02]MCQ9425400.1 chemotaxis protein CheW [Pseudomonas sp. LJDD11]BAP42722.1 CheW domain-containing protein [Pseudomonas sp. StFLB209]
MPDVAYESSRRSTLTCLLLPLSDRYLLLPNVAVAELIDYQDCHADPNAPAWYLGNIRWRELDLPLLSFEAACGGRTKVGGRARIVVLNALGGNAERRYLALLIQNIPRSCKVDNQLSYVDVPLASLELAAVQVGDTLARVPDLVGLEQWLVDAGVVDNDTRP